MILGGVGSSAFAVKFRKRLTGFGLPIYGLWNLRFFTGGGGPAPGSDQRSAGGASLRG